MGIYDREYVRREGPGFLGSWEQGAVCKWLIGVTVAVFIANVITTDTTSLISGPITNYLSLNAARVLQGQVWRLLTYGFGHVPADIWSILFNMLLLWWFGRDLEEMYGSREFLLFYLASVLLGGVCFMLASLAGLPSPPVAYLSSSGPVGAVLMLCAVHFPRRIIYLFFILPVPIWLLALGMVAIDAYQFLIRGPALVTVTLSALVFAFAYGKLHWRLSRWVPSLGSLGSWRRVTRPRLRVYREEEPTPVSVSAHVQGDEEQLEAKIDAILEKISRVGKENLTESEQQLLIRASELFRRRRS